MSRGRDKDIPKSPPPTEASQDAEALLTSEDLFGDLVDAAPEARSQGVAKARKGPIRVQVREPGSPPKNDPRPKAHATPDDLPEDVAALLDAFSEPGEAATRAQTTAQSPSSDAPRVVDEGPAEPSPDEVVALLEAMAEPAQAAMAEAKIAEATAPPAEVAEPQDAPDSPPEPASPALVAGPEEESFAPVSMTEPEDRSVIDMLADEAPQHPLPPAAPPTSGEANLMDVEALLTAEEAIEEANVPPPPETATDGAPADEDAAQASDLQKLVASLRASTGAGAVPPSRLPEPPGVVQSEAMVQELRSQVATKFQAASPKTPTASTGSVDLATLAEDALGTTHLGGISAAEEAARRGVKAYGQYRLLEKIAVGGMAEVFKAKRSGVAGFEKVFAVKRILPHLSDNKEFVDMFVNEANMVAGLTHPNIVQISDLGQIDKSYYIAMEYVAGRDLRSILRQSKERGLRIPLDLTALIVSKVCLALEYAHRKKDERGRQMKIVHRDISPQNILISFDGEVKLTDFGIAKAATKATITDQGALRGKLLYMSPEQAWGKPLDRRSDIFSLGIVSYEMITEQKPFLSSSEMSILEMVRACRVAPPTSLNPRVPERLEKVVLKALERDPEERFQWAADMNRDLERILHERQPPTATELARYMEILFDKEQVVPVDETGEHRLEPPGEGLEVDLDSKPTDSPAPPVAREPLSIDKLLKRFGIK